MLCLRLWVTPKKCFFSPIGRRALLRAPAEAYGRERKNKRGELR